MQRLLSRVGILGVGLATVGATINSTLYNGNYNCSLLSVYLFITIGQLMAGNVLYCLIGLEECYPQLVGREHIS